MNKHTKIAAKYDSNIDILFAFDDASTEKEILQEFNKSEIKYVKKLIDSILIFFTLKYTIDFSDEIRDKYKRNLKIAYTEFEETNTLGEFEIDSGYILISINLKQNNEKSRFLTIVHELIHYFSSNGITCGLVYKFKLEGTSLCTGFGIDEGITEKLTNEYAEYIYPGIVEIVYPNNSFLYFELVKIINVLELIYGRNLYIYFFTNNINEMANKFDYKVREKTDSYLIVNPYTYLVCGMDNLLNELADTLPIDIEKIDSIDLAIFELLEFSIDTANHKKLKEILSK